MGQCMWAFSDLYSLVSISVLFIHSYFHLPVNLCMRECMFVLFRLVMCLCFSLIKTFVQWNHASQAPMCLINVFKALLAEVNLCLLKLF